MPRAARSSSGPEYLVLDIETVPDARWNRPEMPLGVEAPFPPTWAHRIIVVGCLWLGADYRLRRMGVIGESGGPGASEPGHERHLLIELSRFVGRAKPVLVTFNGRAFDLPVIALRSLSHGVPLAWYYQERGVRYRYSEEGHMDLCDWLADHGATRSGSLDAVARLFGLPGKVGVDGSQVEGLFKAGQLARIQSYCLADVVQTAFVLLRFRLLQGVLAPAAYQAAAEALYEQVAAHARTAEMAAAIDRAQLFACADPAKRSA
jgi:predicted PolB exonuclease-like 3'-5' exonuclease